MTNKIVIRQLNPEEPDEFEGANWLVEYVKNTMRQEWYCDTFEEARKFVEGLLGE